MRSLLLTVYTTVFFSCFLGKAQVLRNNGLYNNANPQTNPLNISQFEISGRLITQNGFVGIGPIPAAQQTGNFGATARWNSIGNLDFNAVTPNLTQTLNGIRTQINGRGLAWGHSIPAPGQPNAGMLSNPFIEWIGNQGVETPGNLEFNYAFSPTGAAATRVKAFTIEPVGVSTDLPNAGANAFSNKGFIGQLQSGSFGSFGAGDTWSNTGRFTISPTLSVYGARHQFEGYTFNTGFTKSGSTVTAVQDFGSTGANYTFKFRSFTDPNNSGTVKNIWQSGNRFNNIVLGRQDYSAVNSSPFYLSLFDGVASNSNSISGFVDRAGIYVATDGNAPDGGALNSYAAIVGDVSGSSSTRYGILGIAQAPNPSQINTAQWAGYFLGDVGYTGVLVQVSDKKFKMQINDEEKILPKLMQLAPKNYKFDVEKYKRMALSNKLQHGLISQDVEAIFPELVQEAYGPNTSKDPIEDGKPIAYKGLNYTGFIPMLIKAIQEQQRQIEELQKEVTAAKNTFVFTDKNALPAEIENKAYTLSQNVPNPFSEKTTISYTIPTNVSKAVLAVFDLNGKMLQQYTLLQGKNQLTINGNSFTAGMYIYSLIADGQEVVSKRMILTR